MSSSLLERQHNHKSLCILPFSLNLYDYVVGYYGYI